MRDCSKLNDLAQAELDALIDGGITPTAEEIVRINWLAWQVETPEHRLLSARGQPVFVGGVTLWPLTASASEWFSDVAIKMPASLHERALAYAMAYGRGDGSELDQMGREAEKAVHGWSRGLRCTRGELTEALAQVISQSETDEMPPSREESRGMSAGEMSAFLCAAAGGTPDLWERQVSSAYVLEMFRAIMAQNRADDRPMPGDPRIEATKALAWYVHQVKESRKVTAANG